MARQNRKSVMTRFTTLTVALAAMIVSTGCNAALSDAYQRQLQDRDARIEKMEKEAKKRDAKLARLEKRQADARQIAEQTVAEAQADQKPDADASPLLPGPGKKSDYQIAGEQQVRPALAFTRPPAINPSACQMRQTGPFVGYAQGSPLGDPYPMLLEDHSKPNMCRGACEAISNDTNKFYEVRMSAMDPSRPGLAGTNAAVTLCNGAGLLSAALVQRDFGPPEMVTLLPPGAQIVIGPIVGTAQITLNEYVQMAPGIVWPKGGRARVEDPRTFPTGGWTGILFHIQPRA
jgi:hypothetical protein